MPDSFSYDSFSVSDDRLSVSLMYTVGHDGTLHHLTETFSFSLALPDCYEVDQVLRALHLACGISYYKIFMPPELSQPYAMDESEAAFWNGVFRGGLGEFLYVNKLDPAGLAKFTAQDGKDFENDSQEIMPLKPSALLGIGGGKDSIVAGEALKKIGVAIEGFVMATGEALGQTKDVATVMGVPLQVVGRVLDKQLLDLQDLPGAHKGHIPVSLIFALVGSLLALANGSAYVVVANEDSASTPRTTWAGEPVNHQWSKSIEFEGALQVYLHSHVSPDLTYFSAIRPLGSVGVAKVFAKLPQYFEVFTSDNFVFRIDPAKRPNARWSLESPKSLSSFILLTPWLTIPEALRIFGQNFLDVADLRDLFLALIGIQGEAPLDCVGTAEELAASIVALKQQGKWQGSALTSLPEISNLQAPELLSMTGLSQNQRFPADLGQKLTDALTDMTS